MALATECPMVASLSERFYRRVYAFARQMTDPATAEDVTQEVFLRLMRMEDLGSRQITASYLIKIAHNCIRGQARQGRRFKAYVEQVGDELCLDSAPDAVREAVAEGSFCLDDLSQREQETIRLTVCQGLSLREASEALGVPLTTVTNWKYRGLRKLAEHREAAA